MDRSRTPRLILLAATLALGGCSLALSGPARDRPRHEPPRCDTGKGLVVADAVAGSLTTIGTLVALSDDAGAAALLPATIGAAFFLSAVGGNSKVNACRAAFEAYEAGDVPLPATRDEARRAAAVPGPPGLAPGALRGVPPRPAPAVVTAPPWPAPAPPRPTPAPAPAPAPAVVTAPPPVVSPPAAPAPPPPAAPAPSSAPPAGSAPSPAPPPRTPPRTPASDPWIEFWKELP